jgi:hypothetical protein
MLKLYDRICPTCSRIDRDVFAENTRQLEMARCPKCKTNMKWHPSFGSVDNQYEFYDIHTDRKYSSYREMESHCKANNLAILSKREYESRLGKTDDIAAKLSRNDKQLDEALSKASYRLRHGYKD